MPESAGGERTLPASGRKRERAREQGHVAKSQDLTAAWMLSMSLLSLYFLGPPIFAGMQNAMRYYLTDAPELFTLVRPDGVLTLTVGALWHIAQCVLPIMMVLAIAGIAINAMQVGFLLAPQALVMKLERLNPFASLQKFLSLRSGVELLKSAFKVTCIVGVAYLTMRNRWQLLIELPGRTPLGMAEGVASLMFILWLRIMIAMLIMGLLDYAFQRWHYEQDLKMTVQEARQEARELEGDPRIRQRIRHIQRQLVMQRMMAEVPRADVIVTNPVAYAVALRYDMAAMEAPVVVAKGARLLAERVRALAVTHDVPIIQKPELARMLYRTVEVGQPVPPTLFRAVAEVLAFVYQIDRRAEKVKERHKVMAAVGAAA